MAVKSKGDGKPGNGIFISYRSADTGPTASALGRELRALFDPDQVFIDHLGIQPGTPFPAEITRALSGARVVLALIGNSWLLERDEFGARLIDRADDWVRKEIEYALDGPAALVPVYVDGARPLPRAAFATAPSLAPIADLQGLQLGARPGSTIWP
jgi:TIR domain